LPILLTLAEHIPSDAAKGDPVRFRVAHEVRVGDTVVIAKGAPATGAIIDGARKKLFGIIGGKITFRLETVEAVDGRNVAIRATQARRRDGSSKRPVNTGAEYLGYIDGSNTVTVKR
jgi:hypothetical protein